MNNREKSMEVFALLDESLKGHFGDLILEAYKKQYKGYNNAVRELQDFVKTPYFELPEEVLTDKKILFSQMDVRRWLSLLNAPDSQSLLSISKETRSYIIILHQQRNKLAHDKPTDELAIAKAAYEVFKSFDLKEYADRAKKLHDKWAVELYTPDYKLDDDNRGSNPHQTQDTSPTTRRVSNLVFGFVILMVFGIGLFQFMRVFPDINFLPDSEQNSLEETIPPDKTSVALTELSNFVTQIATYSLSERQINELHAILETQGYITQNDLDGLGLTSEMIQDMQNQGYLPASAVIATIDYRNTQVAFDNTATAEASPCELVVDIPSVWVRSSPVALEDESNTIRWLLKGDSVRGVAHNGGVLNSDLWWVIRTTDRDGASVDGWISSVVVVETNPQACLALPRALGSSN